MSKKKKLLIFLIFLIISLFIISTGFAQEPYHAKLELLAAGITPVILPANISKIIITRNGITNSISITELVQNRLPADCSYNGLYFEVKNLTGSWSIYAQIGSDDGFKIRLTIYDSNDNIVWQGEDNGAFGHVGVRS